MIYRRRVSDALAVLTALVFLVSPNSIAIGVPGQEPDSTQQDYLAPATTKEVQRGHLVAALTSVDRKLGNSASVGDTTPEMWGELLKAVRAYVGDDNLEIFYRGVSRAIYLYDPQKVDGVIYRLTGNSYIPENDNFGDEKLHELQQQLQGRGSPGDHNYAFKVADYVNQEVLVPGGYRLSVIKKNRDMLDKMALVGASFSAVLTPPLSHPPVVGSVSLDQQLTNCWNDNKGDFRVVRSDPSDPTKVFRAQRGRLRVMLNTGRSKRPPAQMDAGSLSSPFDPRAAMHFGRLFSAQLVGERVLLGGVETDIMVNAFPFFEKHFMIIPEREAEHNQVFSPLAAKAALGFLKEVDNSSYKVAFNSTGAFASINHLHLHAFEYPEGQMPVELAGKVFRGERDGVRVSELSDWYVKGMLLESENIEALVDTVTALTTRLCDREQPFNMIFTRNQGAYTIYVFPRKFQGPTTLGTGAAYLELGGEILFVDEDNYQRTTEAEIKDVISEVGVDPQTFSNILQSFLPHATGSYVDDSTLRSYLDMPSAFVIERGLKYHRGELKTSPVQARFRPSRKDDLYDVAEMPEDEREGLIRLALESLAKGEGVISPLAAGASTRMNVKDAPDESKRMVKEMYGEDREIKSKAAIPIGRVDGQVMTFLGAVMRNVSRLEQEVQRIMGRIAHNRVLITTNKEYAEELDEELSLRDNYGVLGPILKPREELGYQYNGTVKDTEQLREKLGEDYEAAKEAAEKTARQLQQGVNEAVVLVGEKAPLGHGEYLHQMVSSGILLELMQANVRWISVRNIDNSAATFDEDWLVTLGLFLKQDLDFQAEVSPRLPGQKGGALVVTQSGQHQLQEDPSFDATWEAYLEDMQAEGYRPVDAIPEGSDLIEKIVQQGYIEPVPHRMDVEPSRMEGKKALLDGIKNGDLQVFESIADGRVVVARRITSRDTYWFNDAVALFRPEFLLYIYGKTGQSREEFMAEMAAASSQELEAIAHRGRIKFPTIIDPKPAKTQSAAAVKIETNMWQSTGVAGEGAKIRAVGVRSAHNIDLEAFKAMSLEERAKQIGHLRFLGTKQWTGPAESYESNKIFIDDILEHIAHGPLIPSKFYPSAPPVAQGGNIPLLMSQLRDFEDTARRSLDAAGHIAGAIGTTPEDAQAVAAMGMVIRNYLLVEGSEDKYLPVMVIGVARGLSQSSPGLRDAFFKALLAEVHKEESLKEHPVVDLLLQVHVASKAKTDIVVDANEATAEIRYGEGEDEKSLKIADALKKHTVKELDSPVRAAVVPVAVEQRDVEVLKFLSGSMLRKQIRDVDPFQRSLAALADAEGPKLVTLESSLLIPEVRYDGSGKLDSYRYAGVGLKGVIEALPKGRKLMLWGPEDARVVETILRNAENLTDEDVAKMQFIQASDIVDVADEIASFYSDIAAEDIPREVRWLVNVENRSAIDTLERANYAYLVGRPGISVAHMVQLALTVTNLGDAQSYRDAMLALGIAPTEVEELIPAVNAEASNRFELPPARGTQSALEAFQDALVSAQVKLSA